MKLLRKTGLYYLLATVVMYVVGSLAFYQFLKYQLRNDTIEKIYEDKARVIKNLSRVDSASHVLVADDAVSFYRIPAEDTVIEQLKDTDRFESSDSEINSYLQLQFKANTRSASYRVVLAKSLAERENLIAAIAYSFLFLMAVFALGVFFINWWISKKVWGPFYFVLQQLRNFNLEKGNYLSASTNITEFKELNAALESMTQKMKSDYQNLKEFTENASHEIQTPLAGIRSKVELMLQNENLDKSQVQQLTAISDGVNRLSRLSQSLLLLSKIENDQFRQTESVSMREILEKQVDNLRELISAKGLELTVDYIGSPQIKIHPYLIDILIANLLMNAIRHNIENGFISVKLDETKLTIQNSGNELRTPAKDLFNRFKKDNSAGDSMGIGLSIVQKICDANNLSITYSHSNKTHLLFLQF